MALKNDLVFSIRGKTKEDCIAKLNKQYKKNYHIMNQKAVTLTSFFGMIKRSGVELSYVEMESPKFDFLEALNRQNEYQQKMQNQMQPQKPIQRELYTKAESDIKPQIEKLLEKVSFLEASAKQANPSSLDLHPSLQKIQDFLERNDFSLPFSNQIMQKLRSSFSVSDLDDYSKVYNAVIEWIGDSFLTEIPFYNAKPQIIMLIGPTGVGKTTTIPKIAFKLKHGNPLQAKTGHMITIDKMRIAAIPQLETYAKYLGMDLTVASSSNELRNQVETYGPGVDFLIIDTVGVSPSDTDLLLDMKDILHFQKNTNIKTYLTLSASTKNSDMKEIMASYEMFNYDSLIITKLDETKSVGNIISLLAESKKSLSYVTTGQQVPRDIEEANPKQLLSLLKHDKKSFENN